MRHHQHASGILCTSSTSFYFQNQLPLITIQRKILMNHREFWKMIWPHRRCKSWYSWVSKTIDQALPAVRCASCKLHAQ